jgi:hypothetical protein
MSAYEAMITDLKENLNATAWSRVRQKKVPHLCESGSTIGANIRYVLAAVAQDVQAARKEAEGQLLE